MTDGIVVGIILFGLLIYGIATGFDDGTRVDSIENRLVTFDGSVPHSSSTCTDKKNRLVLAINYF